MNHLVARLQHHAQHSPRKTASIYLKDGEQEFTRLSFKALDSAARALAAYLQSQQLAGQTVMLLFPTGTDFIISFFACAYAGVIAVPVLCPNANEFTAATERLHYLALDADVVGILTDQEHLLAVQTCFTDNEQLKFIHDMNSVTHQAHEYHAPQLNKDTIVYLQYTSGSTANAKAVIITHKNLTHSLSSTAQVWNYQANSITLNWAPHTHVYGLICGLLLPIYQGTTAIIMPPSAFIQRPARWLLAISTYHATHSGCPNFGYELCQQEIKASELSKIDLTSWQVAVNGGENVQAATLEKFINKFKRCGFKAAAFNSAFGMSEVTGAIAVSPYQTQPTMFHLNIEALKINQARMSAANADTIHYVSNGQLLPGLLAKIVDPVTLQALAEGNIGEIWLQGASVAQAYWRRPSETAEIFHATLAKGKQRYFRTGDLGFLWQGELCLTGRLKEVLVIRGKKYYPLDLESAIKVKLPTKLAFMPRIIVSHTVNGQEEISCLQELPSKTSAKLQAEILKIIRLVILEKFGMQLYSIAFVPKHALPKTASGKLQRKAAQQLFLQDKLTLIYTDKITQIDHAPIDISLSNQQRAFIKVIARVLKLDVAKINLQAPISHYGFDSIHLIKLATEINTAFGLALTPASLFEFPTLDAFYKELFIQPTTIPTRQPTSTSAAQQDIAIIGISGRFPDAANVKQFWQHLCAGKNVISEIPTDRWDWRAYDGDPVQEPGKTRVKWGGFMPDIAQFDANFFNISPHEAQLIDPQQRLLLQEVQQALADAGYTQALFSQAKTGVFVGVFNHDYAELLQQHAVNDAYITTGASASVIANRVSYVFNFNGPSETIDTACSSSLVALHHAVRAIQQGDCQQAIVGGVNALLTPTTYLSASQAGMLSEDGQCKSFDARANGYVRGEGIIALILKPLQQACDDQDQIYGVIKGSAINHGGHGNSLTAPNPNAQAEVIMAAHRRANIAIDSMQYIETHGTGTALGDPIEINGLKKAFNQLADEQGKIKLTANSCALGALKTHIGHLEAAAGLAGVVKILLAFRYEYLPQNLHFQHLNPYIEFNNSPFYLLDKSQAWLQQAHRPRRAGISSFGFGGTNAHVIIEEAPALPFQRIALPRQIFATQHYWLPIKAEQQKQKLTYIFSSADNFIQQHKIFNAAILPGVVFLEMARAVSKQVYPQHEVVHLQNIQWLQTLAVDEIKKAVSIDLIALTKTTKFSIHSHNPKQVHAEGEISLAVRPAPTTLNIAAITSRLTSPVALAQFSLPGMQYGPDYAVVKNAISQGHEALVEISLSENQSTPFTWDPCLLDGMLRSVLALLPNPDFLYVPFSLDDMVCYADLPKQCLVYVTLASDAQLPELPKYDLMIVDKLGNAVMHIQGFALRPFSALAQNETQTYVPIWRPKINNLLPQEQLQIYVFNDHSHIVELLQANVKKANILAVTTYDVKQTDNTADKNPTDTFFDHQTALDLFAHHDTQIPLRIMFDLTGVAVTLAYLQVSLLVRELIIAKIKLPIHILCVYQASVCHSQAWAGWARALQLEQPHIQCRVVNVVHGQDLLSELTSTDVEVYCDNEHQRWVRDYQAVELSSTQALTLKPTAVYLITGGLGGLGLIFARYLAKLTQATIVLAGRSPLNTKTTALLAELNQFAAQVVYVPADISSRSAVKELVTTIQSQYGQLHGIIHSAGITHDRYLNQQNTIDSMAVLAPKCQGTKYLDDATHHLNLDFFVLFSSVAASFGNVGQTDYAFANGYLADFAIEREQRRLQGKCHGVTRVMNWPLWEEGGLTIAPEWQLMLAQTLGIQPLKTALGIAAFEQSMLGEHIQTIILPGLQTKLLPSLRARTAYARALEHPSAASALPVTAVENFLRAIIAAQLKLAEEKIVAQHTFAHYGIDSLMIIKLNQALEKSFGELPKTLFFEYQTLTELTQYFIQHHAQTLHTLLNLSSMEDTATVVLPAKITKPVTTQSENILDTDIAIIGMQGRYPLAPDLQAFWQNLLIGRDCIQAFPPDRFQQDAKQTTPTFWGGFIHDFDQFDPQFFNIAPSDAELMDPQERLFLEVAWQTLEDAAYTQEQLTTLSVGVFVGVMYNQYQLYGVENRDPTATAYPHSFSSSIANRVSYHFNLHGPSLALDTMCSSSLTAIHLACQSIRAGECEMALVGGVNLTVHPQKYRLLAQGKFLATDGRCHSFGAGGDGYVPGEGVGAILLKPLQQALQDQDHIYAIIKGSSLNHGGKTHGFTVPNPNAQAAVMAKAYQQAKVDPRTVSYIEAHGTGTALGDPIEIAGLSKVFTAGPYRIGSVKSNIGHCESAAGMAAVSKVVLQLQHQQIVSSLHAETLNANIQWASSAFHVQTENIAWPKPYLALDGTSKEYPRLAGISSFGAGGANAHLVIQEAAMEQTDLEQTNVPTQLLLFSAKNAPALQQCLVNVANWLQSATVDMSLLNLAYTYAVGKNHFDYRIGLVVQSLTDLKTQLSKLVNAPTVMTHVALNKPHDQTIFAKLIQHIIHTAQQVVTSDTLLYSEQLQLLAKFYVDGYDWDWTALFKNTRPRKISVPTYPFTRQRYWYAANKTTSLTMSQQTLLAPTSLADKVQSRLTQQVAQLLKLTVATLQPNRPLSEYGMDSVYFIHLIEWINQYYQLTLTPALVYAYQDIHAMATYLINEFPLAIGQVEATIPVTSSVSLPSSQLSSATDQPIAIIGMSGLFPQSANVTAFWEHLIAGHDLVTEVPPDRWHWQDYFGDSKQHTAKTHSKWGGFIDNMTGFDAAFFNISAREANLMDPQQRLFMQVVWQAIEDAGYNPEAWAGNKIGLFAGVEFSEYQTLIAKQAREFHGYVATGNSPSMLVNRLSYFLNFQGPSETIATACSSSLVAIHRAVQAIRQGECKLAIAGGVSLMLNPDTLVVTSQLGALSPEGRCKTFDKSANGYVKGEGIAAIVLKPLAAAESAGDHIYAVIRGSAVNHGGKAQSLTAPNPLAQRDLLIAAYTQAGIAPEEVSYIETHGTGTALGDPAEIEGLKLAFKTLATRPNQTAYCGLGSLKTNIGHLEPASGIAGVIKVLLAMQYQQLPGVLHLQEVNPYINLSDSPFYIVDKPQVWQKTKNAAGEETPRVAGVSSFGFGGTNAHIILQESKPVNARVLTQDAKPYYVLAISAKQASRLQHKYSDLHVWLTQHPATHPADLAFTLNVGRAHFAYRTVIIFASISTLLSQLQALSAQGQPQDCYGSRIDKTLQTTEQDQKIYADICVQLKQSPLNANQYHAILTELAHLYGRAFPIDWSMLHTDEPTRRIAGLPTYPFEAHYYWFDVQETLAPAMPRMNEQVNHPILNYLQTTFAKVLRIPPQQITVSDTYEVYGVDSITGLEITERLEQDFGELSKTLLYERNCLIDLAAFLQEQYPMQVAKLTGATNKLSAINRAPLPQPNAQSELSCDIAIIGLHGIFPGANNLQEFWDNLLQGKDSITDIPLERWNYRDYPVMVGGQEKYYQYGGFIEDVDKFDPLFFNISPRDAALMDPQERLFLQSAWSTLEDAAYTREKLQRLAANQVGVFAGVTYNYYPLFIAEEWHKDNRVPLDIQMFSVANRVSYFLNLSGPSLVIDTACSSALAAIHAACESLLRGECRMALAGGVNLSLHPSKYHFLGSFSLLSDQGRCASFAAGGTGYVPAEGVGCVLLKPLAQAEKDHDRIYAVIKSSSINHGGKTSGYTVPNPNAQATLIQAALQKAQMDPSTISYIEAHGTGTALGDPIEIRGLQQAFNQYTDAKQFCAIGSVKSNIGHLESAAGISQLAKVLLQMQHKKLVPSLHAQELNPFIDFTQTAFYVQRELADWSPMHGLPRRAGISSFGAGGTNVHVIVEDYATRSSANSTCLTQASLFVLSAQSMERLHVYVTQWLHHVQSQVQTTDHQAWLSAACYTLQVGRETMPARLAMIVQSIPDLVNKLSAYATAPQAAYDAIWSGTVKSPPVLSNALTTTDLTSIAQAWVQGSKIDWSLLYTTFTPSLMTLPTYPFAKRRCWIATTTSVESLSAKKISMLPAPPVTAPIIDKECLQAWLYDTQWEKQAALDTAILAEAGHWLVFSDHELGFVLGDQLGKQRTIYVLHGETFHIQAPHIIYMNPNVSTDYHLLFTYLMTDLKPTLNGMIYLADFSATSQQQDEVLWQQSQLEQPSKQLLFLLQAITQAALPKLAFVCVTRSSQAVITNEAMQLSQHHLWALVRIFAAEQAAYSVLLIDLPQQKNFQQDSRCIISELANYQTHTIHIAYRANERYTLRFQATTLPETIPHLTAQPIPEAVIITGGLGALGIEVAKCLVAHGTKFLLLTGTTELPARAEWPQVSVSAQQERIANLQRLEESGATVYYAAIDVADKPAMAQLIQDQEKKWGKSIMGVFHLAGITTDSEPVASIDPLLWDKVLRVKIQGALGLHDIFRHRDLQYFMLFSSIAAVPYFGVSGLSAYATANAFLNGLVAYRRQLDLVASSINWVAWTEKGMSHQHDHSAFLAAIGMSAISPAEGMQVFTALMTLQLPTVTVCKVYWQRFLQINVEVSKLDFFKHFTAALPVKMTAIQNLSLLDITQLVNAALALHLQLDSTEIEADVPLQNYGMDSIIGINFAATLNEHFPGLFSPMDLYRYPTQQQIVTYLAESMYAHTDVVSDKATAVDEESISALSEAEVINLLEDELKDLAVDL